MFKIGNWLNGFVHGSGPKKVEGALKKTDDTSLATQGNDGSNQKDANRANNTRQLKPLGAPIFDEPTEGSEQSSDLIPLTDRTLAVSAESQSSLDPNSLTADDRHDEMIPVPTTIKHSTPGPRHTPGKGFDEEGL